MNRTLGNANSFEATSSPAGSHTEGVEFHSERSRSLSFILTKVPGAFIIEGKQLKDERGFFARTFCAQDFEQHGLNPRIAQCSISFNPTQGTLRGMHYQARPHAETKLVRCTRGAIYDVLIDLRKDSPAYLQWLAVELTADNQRMVFVPEGVAHGFQTLMKDTEVSYQISEFYHPECARGVRWDDPRLGIMWPEPPILVSQRDSHFALISHDSNDFMLSEAAPR